MNKILLITTGGTISGKKGTHGLAPKTKARELAHLVPGLAKDFDCCDLLSIDSSNLQPEMWQEIAENTFNAFTRYKGVVITHGTDTLAYTAAALSFMLAEPPIPVVLTGSQLPISAEGSDGPGNLYNAFTVAASDLKGVYVVFDKLVIAGTRAVKAHTSDFAGFKSVNRSPVGCISINGEIEPVEPLIPKRGEPCLFDQIDTQVHLVKLYPGFDPEILKAILSTGCKGLIIEAFGCGGIPDQGRDLQNILGDFAESGGVVCVTTQCAGGAADLEVYEIGVNAKQKGLISLGNMTSEAAITKLMCLLGRGFAPGQVTNLMITDMAGELS